MALMEQSEAQEPLLRNYQEESDFETEVGFRPVLGDSSDEAETTLDPVPQTEVYARRWYVLFVFSLLSATQALMWNTWGPVSDSATLVFGWSGAEIGLFVILGNLTYSLTVFGASYVMDVFGLRIAALLMSGMLALGAAIRCITSHKVVLFWMSAVGALLGGVAGTVTFSGSALFSAVWFPASQRATSTAIINTANFLGVSASFILGPALVHYVNPQHNTTTHTMMSTSQGLPYFSHGPGEAVFDTTNTSNNNTKSIIDRQRDELMLYMYVQAGIMGLMFLLVLVYFPSKPPLPPSVSASTARLEFRSGLLSLVKNGSFWCLAWAYAIPAGVFGVWGSVLNINLRPIGVSQDQAAQIGLYYNLGGGLVGLVVSRFSDLLSGHMKQILIGLNILAAGALWWTIMICESYIPFNLPSLFTSAILASIFINSGVALFYELSSEMCYPVAEGVIGGFLTLLNNIMGIIFLSLLYIPNIGTSWMNWVMFGSTLLGLPLLCMVRAKYRRLNIDSAHTESSLQS